jgi:hypothetical protein
MSPNAKSDLREDDDDMRPEYDFSKGLRGVHAYRFSKLSSDEALILGYWQGNGFEVGSYSNAELRKIKTPDFRLTRKGIDVAVCEVKSFLRDAWLDEQIKKAPYGELAGGLRTDPIFNRVSNAVHTAFKQFESVNPAHGLFNFLVLVNHDPNARPEDLDRVLTGYEDPMHGGFDQTCIQFSEGRIREEKKRIDLYVWVDFLKADSVRVRRLFFGNPETQTAVCELLELDPENVNMIPPAA